jgi:ribosomal protein L18
MQQPKQGYETFKIDKTKKNATIAHKHGTVAGKAFVDKIIRQMIFDGAGAEPLG